VALSQAEIGQLLRGIYQSSIRRQYKLALHLLVLCMIRKGELIGARWDEIDFEKAEWLIPAERMKKDKPHLVGEQRAPDRRPPSKGPGLASRPTECGHRAGPRRCRADGAGPRLAGR
jgi:hypothetical protein